MMIFLTPTAIALSVTRKGAFVIKVPPLKSSRSLTKPAAARPEKKLVHDDEDGLEKLLMRRTKLFTQMLRTQHTS